uniref:Uncharacterized protein n=1 Tax=Melopsittacus undulatus TaxID=13146 RepID=A0A8V5GAI2_MELUD
FVIPQAQTLWEEAKKMEDFRKKQKLHRKKIELIMEAIHKTRKMQYKKTMEAKRLCEQRCRDKDDAEQAVPHNTNVITQRQETKLERFTSRALPPVENIEEEWQKEHVKACEFFETQECEWINYFCNALWLYLSPPRHVWVFGLHKVQAGLISCLPTSSGRAFVEHRARALGVPEPRRSSALPFLLCRRAPLPTLTSAPEFLALCCFWLHRKTMLLLFPIDHEL